MQYFDPQPKPYVSFRLATDLLESIDLEAKTQGKTRSAYLEHIVLQRVDADVDVNDLKNRLFQLEAENHALRRQFLEKTGVHENVHVHLAEKEAEIRSLKQEKMELQNMLRQTAAERNTLAKSQTAALPYWISEDGYVTLTSELRLLQKEFPERSFEALIIDALRVARKNLDPYQFSIKTLKNTTTYSLIPFRVNN